MYKKADTPNQREPNKAIYYVSGYVSKQVADKLQAKVKYDGMTKTAIIRQALEMYFEKDTKNKK